MWWKAGWGSTFLAIVTSSIFTNFTTNFFIVQRHGWMKTHDCMSRWLIPMNHAVSTLNKRPFCLDHFELCNFKCIGLKKHILSTTLGRYRYRFVKSSVLALSLSNHKDVNVKSLGYVSGMRNNFLHAIKMFYTKM
jgi:hypothetical protein